MSDNEIIVVKATNSEDIRCPYCKAIYVGERTIGEREWPFEYIKNGTITKYSGMFAHKCSSCKNMYVIDYGPSTYILYWAPIFITSNGEIRRVSKFESEFFENFTIEVATTWNPEKAQQDDKQYFIRTEVDEYPIFITSKKAEEFVENPEEALKFINNVRTMRRR